MSERAKFEAVCCAPRSLFAVTALSLLALFPGVEGIAHGAVKVAQVETAQVDAEDPPKADTIDALMTKLAAMPGLYARFKESKTIGLLAAPIINTGTIRYHPPGRLLRTIETPHHSSVLLVGTDVWMKDSGGHEHVDLSAHPTVRSFVGSFRSLLAGDRKALSAAFVLTLQTSEGGRWTLELKPRTEAMERIVKRMEVHGHDEVVERLVIEESTGDVSDTRFFDVDAKRTYSAEDVAKHFTPPT